ncbi:MAG: DUF4157 domain-containing protein [Nostoc sp.]|uniref:eCIS core domain-containing protein n=1 Tax=Nostoc sp. TaxID=1180 RepID=UPI002FF933E9
MREQVNRQKKTTTGFSIPSLKNPIRGFGLESSAISRQAVPEIQPLDKSLTHDISRIPLRTQAKLSISQPGDIYEQEADSVAQQVMQRMAQPVNRQSIQREALPEEEEELQMKPLDISTLQRQEMPEDEEELQMKSLDNSTLQRQEVPEDEEELQMKPMAQCQGEAVMAGAPDVEASINQARGGGQAMADNIREPMERAFGADFSGVKVHTDGQSDQLNRSIQARAFTTGQDVFFRQGEYNPGNRGGQELLAHELTHVVQQNGGAVQRSPSSVTEEVKDKGKAPATDEGSQTEEGKKYEEIIESKHIYGESVDKYNPENSFILYRSVEMAELFELIETVTTTGQPLFKHKEKIKGKAEKFFAPNKAYVVESMVKKGNRNFLLAITVKDESIDELLYNPEYASSIEDVGKPGKKLKKEPKGNSSSIIIKSETPKDKKSTSQYNSYNIGFRKEKNSLDQFANYIIGINLVDKKFDQGVDKPIKKIDQKPS